MINIPAVPKPDNPAFFDIPVVQIQDVLKNNLSWLNYSFGRSQRLIRKRGNKDFKYPAVHIRDNNYQSVLPGDDLGNFSFFILKDPQRVDFNPHSFNKVETDFALIFWLNLDNIYPNSSERNTEALKAEILQVLTRRMFLTTGRLAVESIMEEAENIYKEYSLQEVERQYLMQPYAGFRVEGSLMMNETCTVSQTIAAFEDGTYAGDEDGNTFAFD